MRGVSFLRSDRPLVLGHRGARVGVVENTMRAFALAAEVGADGIELDVRLSKSGDVVVLHDEDLARVTNGEDERRAEDLSTHDLTRIDLAGERVPLLVDVLALARERGLVVNVEMKRDVPNRRMVVEKVAALLSSWDPTAPIFVSSFDPLMIAYLGALLPRVPRALLIHDSTYHDYMAHAPRYLGLAFVNAEHVLVNRARMKIWQRHDVFAWTVGSANEARHLAKLGVRGIITDDPAYVLAALKAR